MVAESKPVSTDEYKRWVECPLLMPPNLNARILTLYDHICAGRESGVWKEGRFANFDECLDYVFGWSPSKFRSLGKALKRFGREFVIKYGVDIAMTVLALPPNSRQEREVMDEIQRMYDIRGIAPAIEVVRKIVNPKSKTKASPRVTEAQHLRGVVSDLEKKLRRTQTELQQTQAKLAEAQASAGGPE
jgi:hypothetical protein